MLIELKNITFSYSPDDEPVLKNFSLQTDGGRCLVVEGDNGSGKTTLFRILNGLSFPQEGEYVFDGEKITEKYLKNNRSSKIFHKKIGYLFQNPDVMLFNSKVYDEVAFGPRQMGLSDEETEKRVNDAMQLFGIEHLKDKAPYHLSGGQKKAVALASIISLNPDVLILDEPFAGLDRKMQEKLTLFLSEMKSAGKALIISTHSDSLVNALADDKIML